MLGEERLRDAVEQVLRAHRADAAEVVVFVESSSLTRYAESRIHQNVSVRNTYLGLRLRFGRRAGVAWVNSLEPDAIRSLVANATQVAQHTPEQELPSLQEPGQYQAADWAFDPDTVEPDPELMAGAVGQVLETLGPWRAFGVVSTGAIEVAVANSRGLWAYHRMTDAHITVNPMDESYRISAWAQQSARSIRDLRPLEVAERARRRAEMARDPADPEPGTYTVVLEPLAVAELVGFMEWMGFSARAYQEGRSFLVGKLGQRVFSEAISIKEDPLNPQGFPWPFDSEGTPRRPFFLVERGVARELAYDLKTAQKDGRDSNGCGFSPFASYPMPGNLLLVPGEKSPQRLIEETERGILVTRFWYSNVTEPMSLTLTGMTRDGVFLIENGRVTRAMKNMRYTQSIVEALAGEVEVANDLTLVSEPTWYGLHYPTGILVPTLKIKNFNFTSGTEF